ncbi:hypothetical protein [Parasedimentitalea huanghaiensis]|uniref:Uncharacterized protein n=1 Tax=Parasedimentitalea huanghaiensis TaxID=2682100 RepID=A0A6L6WNA0_9RHOB|nr:hypothetical protein [Zongyanglinia huanghaiensis]MVO17102.1 hypothetical protein [Zongyanglinia huanghaiensis]
MTSLRLSISLFVIVGFSACGQFQLQKVRLTADEAMAKLNDGQAVSLGVDHSGWVGLEERDGAH